MLQYLVTAGRADRRRGDARPSTRWSRRPRPRARQRFRRKIEYLAEFGRTIGVPDVDSQVLSQVMLTVLDEKWKDHLYDLDQLRNAIQYRAYGQKDPLVEYKKEAFEMFEDLMRDIQSTFTERFLKIQVSAERPEPPRRRRRRRRRDRAPPRRPAAPTICSWGRRRGCRRRRRRRGPTPAVSSSLGPARAGRRRPCRRSGGTIPALRVGQEVQEVPRGGAVTDGHLR